jgi:hypothetical protein
VPGAVAVTAGSGCEWVVAVFSIAPLSIEDMENAIRGGKMRGSDCQLDVVITGSRAVRVFPVTR